MVYNWRNVLVLYSCNPFFGIMFMLSAVTVLTFSTIAVHASVFCTTAAQLLTVYLVHGLITGAVILSTPC